MWISSCSALSPWRPVLDVGLCLYLAGGTFLTPEASVQGNRDVVLRRTETVLGRYPSPGLPVLLGCWLDHDWNLKPCCLSELGSLREPLLFPFVNVGFKVLAWSFQPGFLGGLETLKLCSKNFLSCREQVVYISMSMLSAFGCLSEVNFLLNPNPSPLLHSSGVQDNWWFLHC